MISYDASGHACGSTCGDNECNDGDFDDDDGNGDIVMMMLLMMVVIMPVMLTI